MLSAMKLLLKTKVLFTTLILLIMPITSWALSFSMPPKGDDIVGAVQTAQIKGEATYSDIAKK